MPRPFPAQMPGKTMTRPLVENRSSRRHVPCPSMTPELNSMPPGAPSPSLCTTATTERQSDKELHALKQQTEEPGNHVRNGLTRGGIQAARPACSHDDRRRNKLRGQENPR